MRDWETARQINHARAVQLAERLTGIGGVELITPAFMVNEFRLKSRAAALVNDASPIWGWSRASACLARAIR